MRYLTSLTSLCLTLLPLVSASTGAVTCDNIQVKGQKYDFSALDKPHSVWIVDEDSPPAVYNTTWTVNICSHLKIDKSRELEDQCKAATNSEQPLGGKRCRS
jgi:autophagy-related protein 27